MKNQNKNGGRLAAALIVLTLVMAISFLVIAGLTWLICWGFSRSWSWRLSVGVFAMMLTAFLTLRLGTRRVK